MIKLTVQMKITLTLTLTLILTLTLTLTLTLIGRTRDQKCVKGFILSPSADAAKYLRCQGI